MQATVERLLLLRLLRRRPHEAPLVKALTVLVIEAIAPPKIAF